MLSPSSPRWALPGLSLSTAAALLVSFAPTDPGPVSGAPVPPPASTPQTTVDWTRELLIKDILVVEDPVATIGGGTLHFGTQMSRLAGSLDPGEFLASWIGTWQTGQVVNGVVVFDEGQRESIRDFAQDWELLDSTPANSLDPMVAPFRLLAIVNRPDLLGVDEAGQVETAGEMRLVYGAHRTGPAAGPTTFTVILEFDVPAASCEEVVDWHSRWHALGSLDVGSAAFMAQLLSMVDDVTLPDPTSGRPNDSNLAQLRTNNFMFPQPITGTPLSWELREFQIDPIAGSVDMGLLGNVTTKQTPHFAYLEDSPGVNGFSNDILAEYLQANEAAILAGTHVVPDTFNSVVAGGTVSLLTGQAVNDVTVQNLPPGLTGSLGPKGTIWWAPGYGGGDGVTARIYSGETARQVRHRFALQTCSGCHSQETDTDFQMIPGRLPSQESNLSHFLTGVTSIDDPIDPSLTLGPFGDLANREAQLIRILELDCSLAADPEGLTPVEVLQSVRASIGSRVH